MYLVRERIYGPDQRCCARDTLQNRLLWPWYGGKTSNLQYIHTQVPKDAKGDLLSIATETERTLFFDFLPLDLGRVRGFQTRFHLYTVPGQVLYERTRVAVLNGADGVVFVADSK